ncbi:MFS transporter [Bradyrhizobium sp. STM 3562]|uniref:MFS transporter n=1 Tax=Bradyrhizobium sp. STM 3562 TaxID=578924 RepID=UPI00388FB91E
MMSVSAELADARTGVVKEALPADELTAPYRWVVLSVAFAAFFVTFLDRLAWANANLLASKSLQIPIAALGLFVTAFYVGYVSASALAGFVTDRIGPRLMLFLALTPLAATTFLFGFTSSFAMGLVLQGLMGLFAGADYAACVKIVACWFGRAERGRALGLFSTAPSIGIACANAVFPALLGIVDWRALYWVLGGLTALVAVICLALLADSPARRTAGARPAESDFTTWRRGLSGLCRDRNLVLIALAGFGANWGTWGFAFWATALMVRGYQLSPVDAGVIALIFGVAAAVSKPIYGFLSDVLGGKRRNLVIYDLLAFTAMLTIFGLMSSKQGFLLAAPFLGLTAVVYSPLLAAMITEKVDGRFTATATGVINAFWQLGSVIVPSIVGVVFAATGSFQVALVILAAGPLLGSLCMVAVRE